MVMQGKPAKKGSDRDNRQKFIRGQREMEGDYKFPYMKHWHIYLNISCTQ